MNIRHVAMNEFVLLQAPWSVKQSRQLIERLQPSHVIVHHHHPRGRDILHRVLHTHTANNQDIYYLFSVQEALTLFARPPHVFCAAGIALERTEGDVDHRGSYRCGAESRIGALCLRKVD